MKHEHFISNEDSKFSNIGELKMYLPHFMIWWNCHLLYHSLIPPPPLPPVLVLVSPIPSELVSVPVFNIHQFTVHICCTERLFNSSNLFQQRLTVVTVQYATAGKLLQFERLM
jgi:hypothetical protein